MHNLLDVNCWEAQLTSTSHSYLVESFARTRKSKNREIFSYILHMQNYGKALQLADSNWLFARRALKQLACSESFDTHERVLQPSNNEVVGRL